MRDFEIIIHPNEDGRCVYFPGDVVHSKIKYFLNSDF